MAMTVRIPEELDRRLEALAAAEHTSKHALLLQAAQLIVDRHGRRAEISDAIDFVTTHDAELLDRLADA
jgi:predicted transcriptional regulator